ncbi:MAG: DNA repair ATPase, partial [Myxococcales bacterium]|nr:DNA repair ATPase [Myxococcales bacterium]
VESSAGFLANSAFQREFGEIFQYYKDAKLIQLYTKESLLLAVFQIGATPRDVKVFRWSLDPTGKASYMDNRGERDHVYPPSHDFKWTLTTREDHVGGKHPHVNILDTVFVETVGGDLTVKVENNNEDGLGIYREPVDDRNQALDDGEIHYAKVGSLILLKVLPFNEKNYRYLVFNIRTQDVVRADAIGQACVQLPEDHGIIFPGGYYLQTGEYKLFPEDITDLEFKSTIPSPNGEDVLYVFHERGRGHYVLFPYNLVRQEVQNPIRCQGYGLFRDGRLIVFRLTAQEATRVHPMQVWQTPFTAADYESDQPSDNSYLGKVGNAELVRGISDCFSVARLIRNQEPNRQIYEDIIAATERIRDSYYWLGNAEAENLTETLTEVRRTAELIIDEFEKVQQIRLQAQASLAQAREAQRAVMRDARPQGWNRVGQFMDSLANLRKQRGHLITLREVRYIDTGALDELEQEVIAQFEVVSQATVKFLLGKEALAPLVAELDALLTKVNAVQKRAEIDPLGKELDRISDGLNVLAEVVAGLEVEDATQKTAILEGISEGMGHLNRVRATLTSRRKELLSAEGKAEFAAQFKLFGQSVSSALSLSDTPEKCDEQLSRLLVQLEELESQFSEFDAFLVDLAAKREEVYEAFGARKQTLLDERQRRIQNVAKAASRIVEGVDRRARAFKQEDELNAFFASDPMVMKLRQLTEQLVELGDSVKSDELQAQLKSAKQTALRGLRDRVDLFEDGGNLIKMGAHRFSVNSQPLEMTMVPRDDGMAFHLTGTNFYQSVDNPEFLATQALWSQQLVSENDSVYR